MRYGNMMSQDIFAYSTCPEHWDDYGNLDERCKEQGVFLRTGWKIII